MPKFKNSNAKFLVIFKQCVIWIVVSEFKDPSSGKNTQLKMTDNQKQSFLSLNDKFAH